MKTFVVFICVITIYIVAFPDERIPVDELGIFPKKNDIAPVDALYPTNDPVVAAIENASIL
jgi:hypothetical protein